jgi:NADPH-dependent 2,4-dienoyl-CoA reductase/sulfur reductase-like enzyme
MLKFKNIIVIGGNAAGPAAAAKAKRTAPDSNVILYEAGNFISTGTCELPYVLSGEIKNFEDIVFYNPESFEKEKGVKVFLNHLVEKIDRKNKKIFVRNLITSHVYENEYDRLILTTGSRAKKYPALNPNLKNVFTLKSVGDLLRIKDYLISGKVKNVLIVGSGYIGLETADALKKIGMNVFIADIQKAPMPGADEEIQRLILDLLIKNDIEFIGGLHSPKYFIKDDHVISVNHSGRIIEIDLVITATGFEPNNDLALGAKLEIGTHGGIKIDQKLRTSDSNIFAAGDNIEVINKITNKYEYIPLATFAHQYGHIAGENAAGGNDFVKPVVKNIAVNIFDKCLVMVGLNSDEALKNKITFKSVSSVVPNLIKVMPESQNVFGKILYEKYSKKIIGASFFGGKEVVGFGDIVASFIHNKISANELASINYNYTPPLSPFVNLLSVLGRKIEKEK